MTHHGRPQEHAEESQSGPVVHGGAGDPLGEGVAEAAEEKSNGGGDQPPLPDDEPKPGL